jgi:tetratricopeptide (TPR) repeat protein
MKLKKQIILFLLILVIGSSFNTLYSQNIQSKPTRQSSFEAFSKGNYEQAYSEFSELLLTYSKDPLYKYYAGVCLVKMKKDPDEAVNLLKQALQGAAVVKTLPSDALFYLGRAQQMLGRFLEAKGSYNLYTEQIGKKAAREQGVPEFILQCNEQSGKVTEPEMKSAEIVKIDKVEIRQ